MVRFISIEESVNRHDAGDNKWSAVVAQMEERKFEMDIAAPEQETFGLLERQVFSEAQPDGLNGKKSIRQLIHHIPPWTSI